MVDIKKTISPTARVFSKVSMLMSMLTLVVLFLALGGCNGRKKEGNPLSDGIGGDFNIVLVVVDTLRSDHLPFYGYEKNTAPFLEQLSTQSVVFENAFAASSWTSPATASIFTSMYPFQHGVLMGMLAIRNAQKIDPTIKINRIPEEIETIAEMLKRRGYRTYGVADNLNIDKRQGFTQGFDRFRTFMYRGAQKVNEIVKAWKPTLTDATKGKYFLYIHYMDPHAPYHRREPWYKPHEGRRRDRISAYDSEINYMDAHFKELFELFQWDKDTLLVVTADHGEGLWDHGLMGHGKTLYREEIQVPLMFYLPGKKVGRRVATNVSSLDILPTLHAALGPAKDDVKTAYEGISLLPLMGGQEHGENNENSENNGYGADRNIYSYLWVNAGKKIEWKSTIYKKWHFLLRLPDGRHLYSLLTDPLEKKNKIEPGKRTATELEKRFNTYFKTSKKYKQATSTLKLDKKKADQLKSLGYVQ